MTENNKTTGDPGLKKYLSPIGAFALAFGCTIGWGAFVMPGTTFLPIAGPMGTAVGILTGGIVMLLIGINYQYMMKRYPDCGGTYTYTKKTMGYDHGFMSTWFILLVYIAILWGNLTTLPFVFRNIFGDIFCFGFSYTVAGFQVYCGEILLCLGVLLIVGLIGIYGGRLSSLVQIIMVALLFAGILFCAVTIFSSGDMPVKNLKPLFSEKKQYTGQILRIVLLAPWAFAGFESITHSAEECNFDIKKKKPLLIIVAALVAGVLSYILLAFISASALPQGYSDWREYMGDIENLKGISSLPAFYAVESYMGNRGLVIITIAAACAIITGLLGNMIAASRLIYSIARDNMIGERFLRLNSNGSPKNAIILIVLISFPIPFFGKTAIGWMVDVVTICVTIAYAYTSWTAYKKAKEEGSVSVRVTGLSGLLVSVAYTVYFLIPGFGRVSRLSTESYLVLIIWSMLGFIAFRYVYKRDELRRFGRSTVVWLSLLFLVFILSMLWFGEETKKTTARVLTNLNEYNENELLRHGIVLDREERLDSQEFMSQQVDMVNDSMQMNSIFQMLTILIALFVMFFIYNSMMKRERDMEIQKVKAEENSRAKSAFLSNMSHDIRTPMNAIIGYTEIARDVENMPEEGLEYLGKIEASGKHLLSLINDVLDMSRIESGKMELDAVKTDIVRSMDDIRDMFDTQMKKKSITYTVSCENIKSRYVMCDSNRLNRVLLNLVSNAYKFTPEGGKVEVTLLQKSEDEKKAGYQIRVKDSGMGMSPEFAQKVFEAYEREKTAGQIQGTGLGMAITKSFIDLMEGSIRVETEKGRGTEFIIDLVLEKVEAPYPAEGEKGEGSQKEMDYSKIRLLLVDDQVINREIATRILMKFGFQVETAENGAEAVDLVKNSEPGYFNAVMMDVQMPVMNGYEATKAIRELEDPALSEIPVIAMTANAFNEDIQAAKNAGMNSHIAKPIDINKMMETLREVLS